MSTLKRPFPNGLEAESSRTGGRGGKGGVRNVNQRLWYPPPPHIILKVTWDSPVGIG